jgi:multidrug efflux pump subunit AcrA (membrane-fusion protein)
MKTIYLLLILLSSIYASSVEISVIHPKVGSDSLTITAQGVVIPQNKTVLSAQTTGILKLFVANNSYVKKGDKIAYIEDERRTQNLQLLKQKLLLEAKALQAQTDKLKNAKEKFSMGVGAKNVYLSEQLSLNQLKELHENTKTRYKLVALEEKNAHLLSSQNATLINLAPQNSYISYGMPLATLLTKNTFVKLFIDAQYIHQIKVGMQVKLSSSYGNTTGVITTILPKSSDNMSETIVKPKSRLPQNLQLNAKVILKEYRGLFIPKESIVLVNNAPAVYLIKDGVAHLVFIDIIKDMLNKVLIKNTLSKGAEIALKNAYMLHDNLEVFIK